MRGALIPPFLEGSASSVPLNLGNDNASPSTSGQGGRHPRGFSLIELLVATSVLALLVTLIMGTVSQSSGLFRSAANKTEAFQSARSAYDSLTRNLSQATLNTYWDYDNAAAPSRYVRKSELHFQCGPGLIGNSHAVFFQAPAQRTEDAASLSGLDGLLNANGYFVEYGTDAIPNLPGMTPVRRFRLKQWVQNTEDLDVYANTTGSQWQADAQAEALPIADNILALLLRPKLAEGDVPPSGWTDSFAYDSRASAAADPQPVRAHQLPPLVQVTIVAIDERAAAHLEKLDALSGFGAALTQGLFSDASDVQWEADLTSLENRLKNPSLIGYGHINHPIEYRIFSSNVPLREAKWSKQ